MATTITKTIGTGGDYTTIPSWNSAIPSDITSTDEVWIGELFDEDFPASGILIGTGVTTDATRYIVLRAQDSVARTGSGFNVLVPGSGPRIRPTTNNPAQTEIIKPNAAYVIFEDFEITQGGLTGTPTGIIFGLRSNLSVVIRFLARRILAIGHDLGGNRSDGIVAVAPTAGRYLYLVRCVALDCNPSGGSGGRGLSFDTFSGGSGQVNVEGYNCLGDNCKSFGISLSTHSTAGSGGKIKARNCVGMRAVDADNDISYNGGGGSDFSDHDHANHASEDNSADNYGCVDAIEGITPDSEILTLGSDYHLEPYSPSLLRGGTDVSGLTTVGPDAWNLLVEIEPDGPPDVVSRWSIGPDSYPECSVAANKRRASGPQFHPMILGPCPDKPPLFWNEGFEGTGYENTWNQGETESGTSTVDEDFATSGVTGAPLTWADQCIQIDVQAAGESAMVKHQFAGNRDICFSAAEFIVVSEGLADNDELVIYRLTGPASEQIADALLTQNSGQLQCEMRINKTGSGSTSFTFDISLDTPYRIEIQYDIAHNLWRMRANEIGGSSLLDVNGTDLTSTLAHRDVRIGETTGSDAAGKYNFDKIELSIFDFPTAGGLDNELDRRQLNALYPFTTAVAGGPELGSLALVGCGR